MPRLGGEADKLGNRYEGLWAVDAALDLIEGDFINLEIEAIGDESAGIDFRRTRTSGDLEHHSIKRQQSAGNWTINRLTQMSTTGRSILGDLIEKTRIGGRGIFSSGTSASELEELIDIARASESFEGFRRRIERRGRLSGQFQEYVVPVCNDDLTAYAALRRLRVRTKNEPELVTDVDRRIRSVFRLHSGNRVDAKVIRLLVADFMTHRLGVRLTASEFARYLDRRGVLRSHLAGDCTVGLRIQALNRAYVAELEALLINRTDIIRQESAIATKVLVERGKHVMLEGLAGSGKSCIVVQVLKRLEMQGIPSLVIRLDRLTSDDQSAQAIGTRRGLPDSPGLTLGQFAGDQPSVLCIDQIDSLSLVSARQQSIWGPFNELLDEARDYPNMRIIFACRSFDLEYDPRLRELGSNQNEVERIGVQQLSDGAIRDAIKTSGVTAATLSQEQMQILSTPLHLYLFLEAASYGAVAFVSHRRPIRCVLGAQGESGFPTRRAVHGLD